jgi:uncharacterized protein YceK
MEEATEATMEQRTLLSLPYCHSMITFLLPCDYFTTTPVML